MLAGYVSSITECENFCLEQFGVFLMYHLRDIHKVS